MATLAGYVSSCNRSAYCQYCLHKCRRHRSYHVADAVISAADAKSNYYDWLLALIDPIALDIGGDGISTISAADNESSFFRPSGDDGFLFRDLDADGVASAQELFGSASTGGFTMLAEFDANLDGRISAADDPFSNLGVWRDFNGDGI